MKKSLLAVVSLLLVCCMLPITALAGSVIQAVHITHSRTVNVRSGPGEGYKILGEVSPDEYYEYLGTKNGWNCIQYTATKKGYVSGKLSAVEWVILADENETDDGIVEDPWGSFVYITHNKTVNVRTGSGQGYKYICEVRPGEAYPYLGTASGWHCIKLDDGSTGYVSGNLTTLDGWEWEITPN